MSPPAPRRRGVVGARARSPYDAQAALDDLLDRFRAAAGATRVSVWRHEAGTDMLVAHGRSVSWPEPDADADADGSPPRRVFLRSESALLSAVIRTRRPVVARADGRRAYDRELAEHGVRSAHGEPLIRDGEVIGVLTIEPAAAASPHLLRQVAPPLAVALAEAWSRGSEQRRTAQSDVLLGLIESAATAYSVDDLLDTACRLLAELDEVERATILLLQDGRLVSTEPADLLLARAVLQSGRTSAGSGPAPTLALPLGRAPDLVGVLILDSSRPHPFSEDVRRLAAAAGAHLGAVIQQIRTRPSPSATASPRVPRPRRVLAPSVS